MRRVISKRSPYKLELKDDRSKCEGPVPSASEAFGTQRGHVNSQGKLPTPDAADDVSKREFEEPTDRV